MKMSKSFSYLGTIGYSYRRVPSIIIPHFSYIDECQMKKIQIFSLYSDSTGYRCLGFCPSSFLIFYTLMNVR